MMTKQIFLLVGIFWSFSNATSISDQDLDGVPDSIDECKNTPFFNEVDYKGCTTSILTLPSETEEESLTMTLGYGYSTNEDLINREIQKNTKFQMSYYLNNWGYTLQTGYYSHNQHQGALDTLLKVKKRIKLNSKLVLGLGAGLRLPTYHFKGNKTDGLLYSSLHYYPSDSLSFFAGYNYTYIGDNEIETITAESRLKDKDKHEEEEEEHEDEIFEGLKNKHKLYIGVGYFFTDNFYMNLLYSDENSKFVSEHRIRAFSSSLYYKINQKWFTTLYYKREVFDDDLHDSLTLKLGYTLW